uniref:Vacuolar protein sorting-associated protein 51 homolog n=1 Tax=Paramoeba aestuarina TaxID=180227 RepID=A0A7S4L5S8_9EUKA
MAANPPHGLASVDQLIGEGGGRHRRRKLLLDAYRQAANSNNAVSNVANDPTNIDSPAFDADLFYKGLLQKKRLDALRQIESLLNKKITHLDGNMKTLVYENYNKFISATDTIREMQKHTDSMEDEMHRLKEKMEKIEESSEKINETIGPRRERIEELTAISRLLKKREFLFQLPARLEHCLEMGALNQTVEYYTKTVGILKKYSHMSSFDSILKECQGIMDRVTEILKERVGNMNTSSSEATDAVKMLLKLKYPRATLWPLFLETRAGALEASLPKQIKEGGDEDEEEDVCAFIQELNPTFLGAYLEMASAFRVLFLTGDYGSEEIREAESAFEVRSKSLFTTFLNLIRSRISGAHDPEEVKQALIHLYRNMENVNAAFPKLGITEKSNSAIRNTIYDHLEKKFVILQQKAEGNMKEMNVALFDLWVDKGGETPFIGDPEPSSPRSPSSSSSSSSSPSSSSFESPLSGGINPASENLLYDIADAAFQPTINEIRKFVQNQAPFLTYDTGLQEEVFSRHKQSVSMKICLKVQQLFLCLNELALLTAQEAGSDPDMKKVRACYLLCLSQFCATFRTTGVRSVQRMLRELPTEADYVQLQTAALADRLRDCTVELLKQYVGAQARRLSRMIRKTIDTPDWMESKEPRGVRPVLDMIFDEFKTVDNEICRVFQDSHEDEKFEIVIHQEKKPNQKFGGKKLDLSVGVRMERKSLLTAITHRFLKSFLEAVRLKTFGRCGYNQMQVDLAFTAAILGSYIGPGKVRELTDEVLYSVSERCVNPEPFNHAVIESICKEKLGLASESRM